MDEQDNLNSGLVSSESRVALANSQSPSQNVKMDLIMLSLPAIAGQAIEPLAQLMETACIGKLGKLFFVYALPIVLVRPRNFMNLTS